MVLSKAISRGLRHEPGLYGLELDEAGWVEIDDLIAGLRRQGRRTVSISDIEEVMRHPAGQRYEILDGRIRALYGHSFPASVKKNSEKPPPSLFHGTARASVEKILAQGLLPMKRQHVHLSVDEKTAHTIGLRKDPNPAVLCVNSAHAFADGVNFFRGNTKVWLAEAIPADYLDSGPR